jgi:hypothetical protein
MCYTKIHVMKIYKIYTLKDPNSLEIRYIGTTTRKLNERLSQHKWEARNKKGTHKRNWIKTLLDNDQIPIIGLIEEVSEDLWESREKYWIEFYQNLTNISEGGKGVVIDRKWDSVQRSARAKYKPVVQLNSNKEFVRQFESLTAAKEYMNFRSIGSIYNSINKSGNTNKAGGFYWMYLNDYLKLSVEDSLDFLDIKRERKNQKSVYIYDLNGTFLKEVNSVKKAVCFISPEIKGETSIRKAIKKKRKFKNFYVSFIKYDIFPITIIYRIVQLDMNYNVIAYYKAIRDAERQHGFSKQYLNDIVHGKWEHKYKNFYWMCVNKYKKEIQNNKDIV